MKILGMPWWVLLLLVVLAGAALTGDARPWAWFRANKKETETNALPDNQKMNRSYA